MQAERQFLSSGRRLSHTVLFYLFIVAALAAYLFPIYWMVQSSVKNPLQNTMYPPIFWFTPTFSNYKSVFQQNPFVLFLLNSLVIGLASTGLGLVLGLPAAYAIARFRHQKIALLVLIARITPGISYLVPWFIMFSQVRMVGSYTGLILTHLTVGLPLIIWIMIGFYEDIPVELEQAALIDGCSRAGVFLRVALPLSKPGIATAGILSFIMSWNNFLYSAVLADDHTRTLPVAVYGFLSFGAFDWGALTAAATLITMPVMILALLIQRHIVGGLAMGAVKG
jgi:multiple sugar transport system permease protein